MCTRELLLLLFLRHIWNTVEATRRPIHSWQRSPAWDETMGGEVWEHTEVTRKLESDRMDRDPPPSFSVPMNSYMNRHWKRAFGLSKGDGIDWVVAELDRRIEHSTGTKPPRSRERYTWAGTTGHEAGVAESGRRGGGELLDCRRGAENEPCW